MTMIEVKVAKLSDRSMRFERVMSQTIGVEALWIPTHSVSTNEKAVQLASQALLRATLVDHQALSVTTIVAGRA